MSTPLDAMPATTAGPFDYSHRSGPHPVIPTSSTVIPASSTVIPGPPTVIPGPQPSFPAPNRHSRPPTVIPAPNRHSRESGNPDNPEALAY